MASVGDFDADGVNDVAVGHPGYSLKRGHVESFSGKTGAYIGMVQKGIFGERFGDSLANVGDFDGDGFDELLVGAPSNDVGFTDSGAAYLVNSDGLDDFAVGAPNEVLGGQQSAGTARVMPLAKGPVAVSVEGVHSTLAGEVVLYDVNLLAGTKVELNGPKIPSVQVSVNEIRAPVGAHEPGGFQTLVVSSALSVSEFPGGVPRYPALECSPTLPLGQNLQVRLAGGEPGVFVLACSNQLFAAPAPFSAFGWYYGLDLIGDWIVAAGAFTPEYMTA